jgi:hypothetical protein
MTLPRDIPITTDLADEFNIQKFLGQGKRFFYEQSPYVRNHDLLEQSLYNCHCEQREAISI